MKKTLIYALALASSLVACTDDYTDWAAPQHADPEEAYGISFSAAAVSPIDLATVTTDSVAVFTPSISSDVQGTASYQVQLDATHALASDAQGKVAVEELTAAVIEMFGQRPTERTIAATVQAFYNVDGASSKASAQVEIKVTPEAPVIESAYYLIGTNNAWALDATTPFNHSGADVYEDPVFTVTVAAPVDAETGARLDFYWKVAPQSAIDAGEPDGWNAVYGCATDGDTSLTGSLIAGGSAGSMMQPATDGALFYNISVNMLEGTYAIAPMAFEEYIYLPGNHQGWNTATAPALYSPASDGIYTGFSYLDGGFKFTRNRENYNNEYNYDSFTTYNGDFSAGDGSNIMMDTPGYYYLEVNVPESTLTATQINTMGIIGDATPGAWDADTPMTYDAENACWTVTVDLTAASFKFRANADWAINLGGTIDNLTVDGDNIAVAEAGTYVITLYASRTTSDNIYCTMVKQ